MKTFISFRILDIRFPQACVNYAGWVRLLRNMKTTGIGFGHISIPEDISLRDDELLWLEEFAFSELPVRGAFRR